MPSKPQLWRWPPETIWEKYCGFLDLSLAEFSQIQRELLLDELLLVHTSVLGRRLLRGSLPRSIEQFRQTVALTTYEDYQPELESYQDASLSQTPCCWTASTRPEGQHFPYTRPAYDVVIDNMMAAIILSCATRKREVNLRPEDRLLWSAPVRPMLSGWLSYDLPKQFGFPVVVEPSVVEGLELEERLEKSFKRGLATGVDILVATSSTLLMMGAELPNQRIKASASLSTLHPNALTRLAKGHMASKLLHREMTPKDLWWPKALVAWGMDSPFHKQQLEHYWGQAPLRVYCCDEGGVLALQAWNRKGMTLVPYANFYEFIPEWEAAKSRMDPGYQPSTLLLDQLEQGKRYELVITNLHGMPLLRYRVGHLIRVVAGEDQETGVCLPQIQFEARVGESSGLAELAQKEELALWEALVRAQLGCTDWILRQEWGDDERFLHLYGEFYGELTGEEVADALNRNLMVGQLISDQPQTSLGALPLRVTLLPEGTFAGYQGLPEERRLPATHGRPARLNATDAEVAQLLEIGGTGTRTAAVGVGVADQGTSNGVRRS